MKPLSFPQQRLLSLVETSPGFSRARLARLLYPEQNDYHRLPRTNLLYKALENRGLVELDGQAEGERAGVLGVWKVGHKRAEEPGYLGVFGRVIDG